MCWCDDILHLQTPNSFEGSVGYECINPCIEWTYTVAIIHHHHLVFVRNGFSVLLIYNIWSKCNPTENDD